CGEQCSPDALRHERTGDHADGFACIHSWFVLHRKLMDELYSTEQTSRALQYFYPEMLICFMDSKSGIRIKNVHGAMKLYHHSRSTVKQANREPQVCARAILREKPIYRSLSHASMDKFYETRASK